MKNVYKVLQIIIIFLITSILVAACGTNIRNIDSKDEIAVASVDYSEEASWLALPENANAHPVDVFFVYPTIYQGSDTQDISDPEQIKASKEPLYTQASVFSESANIYAPLYRQLGKAGFSEPDFMEQLEIGEQDVKDALLYYLAHFNKGKPFIIAGHSQGSSTLAALLTKIWGTTGAEERMIATYILGYSITEDNMMKNPAIRMSEDPLDTGCFIAWNTMADGMQDQAIQILPGAVVTNPLNWISTKEDGEYVPADKNLGAVFFTGEGYEQSFYPEFSSAQVKAGGLVCDPIDTQVLSDYPIEGLYHRDDYSLFYKNIANNIQQRIDEYFGFR